MLGRVVHPEKSFIKIQEIVYLTPIRSKNTFRTNMNLFDFEKSPF